MMMYQSSDLLTSLERIRQDAAGILDRYGDPMGKDRDIYALAEMVEGLAQALIQLNTEIKLSRVFNDGKGTANG